MELTSEQRTEMLEGFRKRAARGFGKRICQAVVLAKFAGRCLEDVLARPLRSVDEAAELRRHHDRIADRMRQDAICDATCRAVKLVDGIFYRDYAREEELAAAEKARLDEGIAAWRRETFPWEKQ
jgi:hypothetical protein